MTVEIGHVEAIFRYPVKSMAGESLEAAEIGWHGLEGDRSLAFRRLEDRGGFPWLTASKLPDLLRFTPQRQGGANLPTHIRTPEGQAMPVFSQELAAEISRLAGLNPDVRRFRPNIVARLLRPIPFQEDEWLGGVLSFGEGNDAPAIIVTQRDVRCAMVNLDPDTATPAPEVLKAVVRANQNHAGIYATVTRTGRVAVGQTIYLRPTTDKT
jgi:uncharacterized protein